MPTVSAPQQAIVPRRPVSNSSHKTGKEWNGNETTPQPIRGTLHQTALHLSSGSKHSEKASPSKMET